MYEAIFCLLWLMGGFIAGVSGLGGAIFAVPFISLFLEPQVIVPVANCLAVVICLELGWVYRKDMLVGEVLYMMLGALPGLVLGTYILLIIPVSVLLMSIGIVMVSFVLWQFLHKVPEKAGRPSIIKALAAGFFSGLFSTSVSFSGPPCGVYALHMRWTQRQSLGTMNAFVVLASLVGVAVYYKAGLMTEEVLYWSLYGAVSISAGVLLAVPVNRFVNVRLFRTLLLIVIGVGGISCIVKSFLS